MDFQGPFACWTFGGVLLVVLRFCVDPGIVRDGRGTLFLALGGRFRARGGGFAGVRGVPPNLMKLYICIAIQTSATFGFGTARVNTLYLLQTYTLGQCRTASLDDGADGPRGPKPWFFFGFGTPRANILCFVS